MVLWRFTGGEVDISVPRELAELSQQLSVFPGGCCSQRSQDPSRERASDGSHKTSHPVRTIPQSVRTNIDTTEGEARVRGGGRMSESVRHYCWCGYKLQSLEVPETTTSFPP